MYRNPLVGRCCLCVLAMAMPRLARADDDAIEAPWGTVHADLGGTASTTGFTYSLGEGPLEEKWRLDIVAEGHDRPAGRSSIVFDKDGNLYWITTNGGGTAGVIRIVSVAPDGHIRWFGNDGAGNVHALGSTFGGASPVVGGARVYAAGDNAGTMQVAAFDKGTGTNLWTTELPPSVVTEAGKMLTPVLFEGKLYVVGVSEGKSQDVHRVDAETGEIDWSATVPEVAISNSLVGQMAFVPDAFGPGAHGIYFNGDSTQPSDGVSDVYGIRVDDGDGVLGWMSEGGKVARSHVIYSEAQNLLYTLTWSDYGAQLYAFDPATGFVGSYANSVNTGHGFYDVGALEFDGESIIAGGFDGYILRYSRAEDDSFTDQIIVKGGSTIDSRFWGETRVLGQLLRDGANNSILISGTNSLEGCGTHVVGINVTQGSILWEYDTGNIWDHNFLYAGGPLMGPDGKIYYFERRNPAIVPQGTPNTTLVALGKAENTPPPTAGLILVGYQNREIRGIAPDQCIQTGEIIQADGACSTGKGLSYEYSVDPADDVTLTHASATDPHATIRFHFEGTYTLRLKVQNTAGSAEYTQEVCVANAMPVCGLVVTMQDGTPIDSEEDDDDVPCVAVGARAIADAAESFGGDLDLSFSATPPDGVVFQPPDPEAQRAEVTFNQPGVYMVLLTLTNNIGTADCTPVTVCVTESEPQGGRQLPGDMDQNGKLELTDAVRVLGHLFLGTFPVLPCEGGDSANPGPGELALIDVNNDQKIDLSDAVYILGYLFLGTNGPPALGTECTRIQGCPDNAACGA